MLPLTCRRKRAGIDAVLWLSRELATNSVWDDRIVVVVSHDRFFLDDSCTDCLHISGAVRPNPKQRHPYDIATRRLLEFFYYNSYIAVLKPVADSSMERLAHPAVLLHCNSKLRYRPGA